MLLRKAPLPELISASFFELYLSSLCLAPKFFESLICLALNLTHPLDPDSYTSVTQQRRLVSRTRQNYPSNCLGPIFSPKTGRHVPLCLRKAGRRHQAGDLRTLRQGPCISTVITLPGRGPRIPEAAFGSREAPIPDRDSKPGSAAALPARTLRAAPRSEGAGPRIPPRTLAGETLDESAHSGAGALGSNLGSFDLSVFGFLRLHKGVMVTSASWHRHMHRYP